MQMWQQDWISRWALYSPDKIAVKEHDSGKDISFAFLNRKANGIAQRLHDAYLIRKGDRIAVLAEYSIDYIALFSAAQKLGFAIVPMNYRLSTPEISEIIHDAEPKMVLATEKYIDSVSKEFEHLKYNFSILEEMQSSDEKLLMDVDENDSLFIIYTSGTTGKPKGVRYTHKMAFWNSINTSISLKLTTESRTLNVMPPFHTGGWNVLLLPFLHHGAYTCLFRKFESETVLRELAFQKCNIFMGVPTMLSMMTQESTFIETDLSMLDYIIVGGESMPIPLIETFGRKGVAIRQGYGMTEVGPNLTSLHQDDAIRKKGSIGRTNFYVQHRIINEHGDDCAPNEAGELWLRGPMVTPGYWRNEAATSSAFSDDGVWFKTGDIVIEDEDKYLFIVDRLKNMYISGAENVYPAEIERVLRKMPNISECAVIGVKDEKWGEVGKAFIAGSPDLTEEMVKSTCISNLAKFKVPKYFVFLDQLPKTDSGKIDRKSLKGL
jgi:fatty-acyl-CoA synthase